MHEQLKNDNFRFIKVAKQQKIPIEKNWQTYANYSYDNEIIREWVKAGNNIGIATGFNDLVVIDFDDEKFQNEFIKKFPLTLTARSGGGLKHLFYFTDNPASFKIQDKAMRTLADIQGNGKQIIISPSTHPNGNKYEFINNEKIAYIPLAEIKAIFKEYLYLDQKAPKYNGGIKKPSLTKVLSQNGVDVNKNPTACPWHNSKGGKCFSFNEEKGVFYCFHCEKAGDVITFIEEDKNIGFKEACQYLNIELETSVNMPKKINDDRIQLELNATNVNNPHILGKKIGEELSKVDNLFYRPYFNEIVEVVVLRNEEEAEKNQGKIKINVVTADRLLNIIHKYFYIYCQKATKDGYVSVPSNLSKAQANVLMTNDTLLDQLKVLDKVLNRPYLYKTKNGLEIEHEGYSSKTHTYYTLNTPDVKQVTPAQAKLELSKILDGFCFETEEDKEMAYAFLLTPALRGLFKDIRERTPCFALIANRERAGKDYLAGVRSIIYTGVAIDHPPIADGERANVEEWRKKFVTMMMNGEMIFHSANNVGYLNNPFFEGLLTSKIVQDRILGSNTQKTLDNTLDFSFSANIGLKWRGDMSGRLRRINLFYEEENPNAREFPIVNLHSYVEERRGYILSCIYSLIIDWFEAGCPNTEEKTFTSFPAWGMICGAIMEYHNLGDPLVFQEDEETSGNQEERYMGALYEYMYLYQQNTDKGTVKSTDIINALVEFQEWSESQRDLNGYSDLDEESLMSLPCQAKGDKLRLGHMITKFKGRILRGIKFKIVMQNKEAKKRLYSFERENANV